MSLKLIRTPLSLVLAGCLVTAFSARADIVIGVAGPFTGPMPPTAISTGMAQHRQQRTLTPQAGSTVKN